MHSLRVATWPRADKAAWEEGPHVLVQWFHLPCCTTWPRGRQSPVILPSACAGGGPILFGATFLPMGQVAKRSRAHGHQEPVLSVLDLTQGSRDSSIPCQTTASQAQGSVGLPQVCPPEHRSRHKHVHPWAQGSPVGTLPVCIPRPGIAREQWQPRDWVRTWAPGQRCPDLGPAPQDKDVAGEGGERHGEVKGPCAAEFWRFSLRASQTPRFGVF